MDATAQTMLAALVGGIIVGGAVLAWMLSEREQRAVVSPEPAIPDGVAAVLSVLRSSAVLIDDNDQVLKASAPAYAFGLVRGDRLAAAELADLVRVVRRDGQIRETELLISRADLPPRTVTARVAPLGTSLVLALVEDRTRERRLEAIRRDFVANVSHELKTPVGAIRLLAEAVGDAADDPEAVRRFSKRMHGESDRLARLVQQIIQLSRLQDDEALDHPTPIDLDEIGSAALEASSTDAMARRIELVRSGETGLAVMGSHQQLQAAVSNLVANAVTYSPEGSTVVVDTRSTEGRVELSVIDQGIGISEDEISRIFERFYRVDPARHRSTGGTGLGLSIVKHVASTHGGEVSVWSEPGHGSTFTLTLPRLQQASDGEVSPQDDSTNQEVRP
ncbi:MAG: ATP-binding protein [Nocardioides sp.]|jgi:two-component system sensor histidine kinase SenX3